MKPELSVAIIFKNEIGCLERCLRSIQPLKERVSCEIVMADTGSTDGSRGVAEKYADILFDFPWIDDFSAARNAVFGRCSGRWALVMDCDEWLDPSLDELVDFLRASGRGTDNAGMVVQRNYVSHELDRYTDFMMLRLLRMDAKPRYIGAIHEQPICNEMLPIAHTLRRTVLHHDGYVMLNDGSEAGKAKRARNVALLRTEIKEDPNNLRRLMQFIESGENEPDYDDVLHRALTIAEEESEHWQAYGPAVFRYAVLHAYTNKLSELDRWVETAERLFSDSYFTRIDIRFAQFAIAYQTENWREAVRYGEAYLEACAAAIDDPIAYKESSVSAFQCTDLYWQQSVRLRLAGAYYHLGRAVDALPLLEQTDWALLDPIYIQYFLRLLQEMEKNADVEVKPLVLACWRVISARTDARATECIQAFREICTVSFEESRPAQAVPPELRDLAERVRAILLKLPPDDPMAVELKSSETYQKIAFLIEG